eukprot:scaffold4289_cov246-Chaetoceros_neogracile.AAC.1
MLLWALYSYIFCLKSSVIWTGKVRGFVVSYRNYQAVMLILLVVPPKDFDPHSDSVCYWGLVVGISKDDDVHGNRFPEKRFDVNQSAAVH